MGWLKNIHDFLINREKVRLELYWIKIVWYIILVTLSSIYIGLNFYDIVIQCFVCQFDGNSLIFILWLILLLFPLFNSIEGYGFKLSKERAEQEKQSFKIKVLTENLSKKKNPLDFDKLETQFKEAVKENKNE